MTHVRILFLASLLVLSASLPAIEAGAIKKACDKASNWLIEHYSVKDKAFLQDGKPVDLQTTAIIVTALCTHPRDYKETSGPFISEPVKALVAQGEKAGRAERDWIGLALKSTQNEKYADYYTQWITSPPTSGDFTANVAVTADRPVLLKQFRNARVLAVSADNKPLCAQLAENVIALQQKNGSFGEDLQVNALAIGILNCCYKALK
ncbi:MAG TPA: hypothetical protein VGP72_11600 [Planctomycetota bacterium]|jgi:hypothetical protein